MDNIDFEDRNESIRKVFVIIAVLLFVIADINLELFIVIIILMILSTIMYNVFTKAFDYCLLKRSLDN